MPKAGTFLERAVTIGAGLILVLVVADTVTSYRATRTLIEDNRLVRQTHEVLTEIEATLSTTRDAESAGRGYVITGAETHLDDYAQARARASEHLQRLRALTAGNAEQQRHLPLLERLINVRFETLNQLIDLRRRGGEAAQQSLLVAKGTAQMNDARQLVAQMETVGENLLRQRIEEAKTSARSLKLTFTISNLLALALLVLTWGILTRDLTKRRRAEETLRESEERARALVDASAQIVWTTDAEGAVLEDSPSWRAFTGQTYEEWKGWGWLDALHPEDRAPTAELWQRAVADKDPISTEYRLRHTSGEWRWTAVRAVPLLNPDGLVRGWIGMNADITELKQAEQTVRQQREWLQVTLTSIGDAVIATDEAGLVTFINPVAQSLTGWPQEEAAGKPLSEVFRIVNEETRRPVENPAMRAMRAGVVHGLANHTLLLARDGSEVPIDDSAAPIKDDAGKIIGSVLIFRDVSQQRRVENERQQALDRAQELQAEAEAANRAKDEFLAAVSHELRNPLNGILGWTRLLSLGKLDAQEGKRAIETIERSVRTQSELIEDLLDVSRVITGKLRVNVEPLDLVAVIERASARSFCRTPSTAIGRPTPKTRASTAG